MTDLKRDRGLPTLRSSGTTEGVANNKLFLRKILADRLGDTGKDPKSINIDFVPVIRDQNIDDQLWENQVNALLSRGGKNSVVIKATTWGSGNFIRFCSNLQEVKYFIEEVREQYRIEYPGMKPDFVVEEDFSAEKDSELSAQFLIENDGGVTFGRAARNIVGDGSAGSKFHWRGNVVAGNPNDSINRQIAEHVPQIKKVAEYYAKLGYRGYLGFDLLHLRSGQIKILEINARITGAMAPLLMLEQLIRRQRTRNIVVGYIEDIEPGVDTEIKNFKQLKVALGDLIYDDARGTGIDPHLPQGFRNDLGQNSWEKTWMKCVGSNAKCTKD